MTPLAVILALVVTVAALTLYVSPFLPLLTALITNSEAPPWVKNTVTAGLAVIVAAVTTAIDTSTDLVLSWAFLLRVVVAMGLAILGYLAQRPFGITDRIERAVPGGIGAPPT